MSVSLDLSIEPDVGQLSRLLCAARERTLAYAAQLRPEEWLGPYLTIVNPPLWEIGHVGWFHEHWCLRYCADGALGASMLPGADALYNSALVPHPQRWTLALPDVGETLAYLRRVQDAVLARLERDGATEHLRYFTQLAIFHEDMHNEAFLYTLQTHGYRALASHAHSAARSQPCEGDAVIAGGRFLLGASKAQDFVFDNEKWAHEVEVKPFRMARAAVSNNEFAAFVDDGGYRRREFWSESGWIWRVQARADMPLYWHKVGGNWQARRFDRIAPLQPNAAVIHINWHEAQAYCTWSQRRLPSEAEWEFAASTAPGDLEHKRRYPWGDELPAPHRANLFGGAGETIDVTALPAGDSAWGVRQMFGNAWEWTSDWFQPYPGFVRDPYKEYSEPWFGDHKVLRGGCYATSPGLLRNTWRNFYMPDRRDVLAGFRTCALD